MQKLINSTINFIDQINWREVGQAIIKAIAFTYTVGYCLGLWVHRTNCQLSAAHVTALGLEPTATVKACSATEPAIVTEPAPLVITTHPLAELATQLEQLTTRELRSLTGTKRKLSKHQFISAYLQIA